MKACALVCTKNGRTKIAPALASLLAQDRVSPDEFEILVIDNGSSDGTPEYARALLQQSRYEWRVLVESRTGKMAALNRGLNATTAEIAVIVDDDNILAPGFIRTLLDLYAANPEVAMIGSHNRAVFPEGVTPPSWFGALAGLYACSKPAYIGAKPHPESLAMIAGAGSSFRISVLRQAIADGYQLINDTTRHGKLWVTGEDLELCHLLGALGWKFMDDQRLEVAHFMTRDRLEWSYARRLARTVGTVCVGIDPFILFAHTRGSKFTVVRTYWQWQALAKIRRLLRHGLALRKLISGAEEGDREIIAIEQDLGSLLRILHERGRYSDHLKRTRAFIARHVRHQAPVGLN